MAIYDLQMTSWWLIFNDEMIKDWWWSSNWKPNKKKRFQNVQKKNSLMLSDFSTPNLTLKLIGMNWRLLLKSLAKLLRYDVIKFCWQILVTNFADTESFRIGKLTNWCVMVTRTTIGLLIMMNLSIWWSVFQFLNKTISDWPSNQMSVWTWIPPVLDFGLIRLKPVRSDSKSRNIQLLIYYILFIQISWRHKSTQVRIWWRHLRWWRHQHTCVPNSIPFIFFEMKNLQIFSFWPSFK